MIVKIHFLERSKRKSRARLRYGEYVNNTFCEIIQFHGHRSTNRVSCQAMFDGDLDVWSNIVERIMFIRALLGQSASI